MPDRSRGPRFARRWCHLLALAALTVWLGGSGSSASAREGRTVGAHAHRCKCGADCGSACCCSGQKPAGPSKTLTPSPTPAKPKSAGGICWASTACGGPLGMPHAPFLTRIDRSAALAILGPVRPDDAGARISFPPLERPRPIAAARLDDPPERHDLS